MNNDCLDETSAPGGMAENVNDELNNRTEDGVKVEGHNTVDAEIDSQDGKANGEDDLAEFVEREIEEKWETESTKCEKKADNETNGPDEIVDTVEIESNEEKADRKVCRGSSVYGYGYKKCLKKMANSMKEDCCLSYKMNVNAGVDTSDKAQTMVIVGSCLWALCMLGGWLQKVKDLGFNVDISGKMTSEISAEIPEEMQEKEVTDVKCKESAVSKPKVIEEYILKSADKPEFKEKIRKGIETALDKSTKKGKVGKVKQDRKKVFTVNKSEMTQDIDNEMFKATDYKKKVREHATHNETRKEAPGAIKPKCMNKKGTTEVKAKKGKWGNIQKEGKDTLKPVETNYGEYVSCTCVVIKKPGKLEKPYNPYYKHKQRKKRRQKRRRKANNPTDKQRRDQMIPSKYLTIEFTDIFF